MANAFGYKQPEVQTQEGVKNSLESLDNKAMIAKTYYSVEMPFIMNDSLPRSLKAEKTKQSATGPVVAPVKAAFNLFDTFSEAEGYAKHMNVPQVILEIKVYATVKPQVASVVKVA